MTVGDGTTTATDTFNWTVTSAGTVTMTTPSNQSNAEGNTVSLSLSASDSGSGTLKYFAEGLPPGLKINPSTGAITGTVAVGDAAYGPYSVTVIATDGTNVAEETFTWTITSPVTISAVSDQTNNEGDTVSLSHQRQRFQQRHAEVRGGRAAGRAEDQHQHRRHHRHRRPG